MASVPVLSPRTAADIDRRIERVLRGLGSPEPPIQLSQVRSLLDLDREFYTADDPGLAREVINRIRVAGIQVLQRPTLLKEAIKKMSLQALYVPDQRRILLDKSLPTLKHRWNEAHEIGHSLLPWHSDMMLGDNKRTLSRHCQMNLEAEANFAAGRLLFLRERFTKEAQDRKNSIETIRALKDVFGNTLSTTLFQFVEVAGRHSPMVGMISRHPHATSQLAKTEASDAVRYFIPSAAFRARFSRVKAVELFARISGYCGRQSGGPLGESELILRDDTGEQHSFFFETFFNRYDALTLGAYLAPKARAYVAR